MGDLARIELGGPAVSGRGPTFSVLAALIGAVLTVFAVTVSAFLFVVFAATLAIVTLLFSLLIGVAALKLRSRPNGARLGREKAGVLSVRPPPAHAWIAYQWDRPRA